MSQRFAEVFQTLDAGENLFSPDVLFDLNMPVWRSQLQGPMAFESQLKQIVEGEVRIDIPRTVSTTSGVVTEHEEHQNVHGPDLTARRLWLCEVQREQIAGVIGYCNCRWDEGLRARPAVAAPMIPP